MVGKLPYCVRPGSPEHHLQESVVLGGRRCTMNYGMYGWKPGLLKFLWDEVDDAVEGHAGHDMDEETVERVSSEKK
jgi:hypothetical protein